VGVYRGQKKESDHANNILYMNKNVNNHFQEKYYFSARAKSSATLYGFTPLLALLDRLALMFFAAVVH